MSKFCGNCGTELNDDVLFCGVCGTPIRDGQANGNTQNADSTPQGKKKSKKVLYITIVVGLVALGVLLFFLLFGKGKEDEEKKAYMNAVEEYLDFANGKGSEEALLQMAPDEVWDVFEDTLGCDLDYIMEAYETANDSITESMEDEYGEDYQISFEVVEEEEMDTEQYEQIVESMEELWDVDKDRAKEAYDITVEVKYSGEEGSKEEKEELQVMKIDKKWYVIEFFDDETEQIMTFRASYEALILWAVQESMSEKLLIQELK